MNTISLHYRSFAYVGNSAADFGETVRTTIFSAALGGPFCGRKELELAFRLEFLFLFHQGKRKEETTLAIVKSVYE